MIRIRRFQLGEEKELAELVVSSLVELNGPDYLPGILDPFLSYYTPERILQTSQEGHMYVAEENGRILGTGSIIEEGEGKAEIVTLFVKPGETGKGAGRALMESLEKDEIFVRADVVRLQSSITARGFYEKMGYRHETGEPVLILNDHYRMEKRKSE